MFGIFKSGVLNQAQNNWFIKTNKLNIEKYQLKNGNIFF